MEDVDTVDQQEVQPKKNMKLRLIIGAVVVVFLVLLAYLVPISSISPTCIRQGLAHEHYHLIAGQLNEYTSKQELSSQNIAGQNQVNGTCYSNPDWDIDTIGLYLL